MRRILLWVVAMTMSLGSVAQENYRLIDNPEYPTTDLAVASYTATDFGVDATGKTDCTAKVQELLDKLANVPNVKKRGDYANLTGGILYMPAGRYLFKGQIVIPRGVTLRGDWKRPVAGEPIAGTILVVDRENGEGTTDISKAFITLQPSTEVSNVAVWYKDQTINNVKEYPATFLYGQNGYWGNDYCNVRHVTLVNSYVGVRSSPNGSGGCHNVFDCYGTPLYRGIQVDCLADVGRFDGISFTPEYWAGSGLEGSPSSSAIRSWTRANAIGMLMHRDDWSYTSNVRVKGYNVGFQAQSSPEGVGTAGTPNGQNYGFHMTDCETGINLVNVAGSGIIITRSVMENCSDGVHLYRAASGPVQFMECKISGNDHAIVIDEEADSQLLFERCEVDGRTVVMGGQLMASNTTFNRDVDIDSRARIVFTGNTMTNGAQLNNKSVFECEVSEVSSMNRALPVFKPEWMEIKTTRPLRAALYVLDNTKYDIINTPEPETLPDRSREIQALLDKAKSEGGGIVYLPSGHYRLNSPLTIPAGVELKGSGDIATVPKNNGAVLECYVGEGDESASPLIVMEPGSGLRGVTVNYPNQDNPTAVKPYPYTIRGNADCYIVNVAVRAAYRVVDLFTNKCDRHYVDYLAGHAFMTGIRIGGGSEGGLISNSQFNTIVYAYGYQTKFGCWPNCRNNDPNVGVGLNYRERSYGQSKEDLDFFVIGDCKDQILYNNFFIDANKGLVFVKDANGRGATDLHAMGNAVDGTVNSFVFEGASGDIDIMNSQFVTSNYNFAGDGIAIEDEKHLHGCLISTSEDFDRTATLFCSNNWGGGDHFCNINGGTVNMYMANFKTAGSIRSFNVTGDAKVNVHMGLFTSVKKFVEDEETTPSHVSITSSMVDPVTYVDDFMVWENNIPKAWMLCADKMMDRTGWLATANNEPNGGGWTRKAIDDDPVGTRWVVGPQVGDGSLWFALHFPEPLTINNLILTTTAGGNGPAGYLVEVMADDDAEWQKVAEGVDGGMLLFITFETVTAKHIRITCTGEKDKQWSIHNACIAKVEEVEIITGMDEAVRNVTAQPRPSDIYSISGQLVRRNAPSAEGLSKGIYIIGGKKIVVK